MVYLLKDEKTLCASLEAFCQCEVFDYSFFVLSRLDIALARGEINKKDFLLLSLLLKLFTNT